jgi:hypothetical protein
MLRSLIEFAALPPDERKVFDFSTRLPNFREAGPHCWRNKGRRSLKIRVQGGRQVKDLPLINGQSPKIIVLRKVSDLTILWVLSGLGG